MKFELNEKEIEKFKKWNKTHICKLKKYEAIGGRLTFSFTPTGLGVIAKVKCGCGEEFDLSNDDEW